MTKITRLKLDGREYVVLARREYERLEGLARVADMPRRLTADAVHEVPAVEYARDSIAREIVRRRVSAGVNQSQLARSAGVRVETLCRIETGKNTPSTATIAKLERALLAAEKSGGRKRPGA